MNKSDVSWLPDASMIENFRVTKKTHIKKLGESTLYTCTFFHRVIYIFALAPLLKKLSTWAIKCQNKYILPDQATSEVLRSILEVETTFKRSPNHINQFLLFIKIFNQSYTQLYVIQGDANV